MTTASLLRLLLPSATWGGAFPLFGTLSGWIVLDEPVGWHTLAGGTMVVTGFSPRLPALRKAAADA